MRLPIAALLAALSVGAQVASDEAVELARRAVSLQQSGDYRDAAAAYRKLLALRPDDVTTHVNLGVVLAQLGQFDDAIREYEAADQLLPGDPRIELNIALAFEKSGRLHQAAHGFEALHAAAPQDARTTMLLADCRLQMGDYKEVIDLLQPLESDQPDDLGIAYMLGMAFLHEGRIQDGQARLDRILRNGDSAEARFLLGVRMFESGDYPAAVRQLASAADLNPNLPQLQSLYGQALLRTGDPDGACDAFHKELASNPNDFVSNLELARVLTFRRKFDDAQPLLEHALVLRPQSTPAKQLLAECLAGTGRFKEARQLAESAAAALPDSADAHRTLAAVYDGLQLSGPAAREHNTAEVLDRKARLAAPGPKPGEMAPDFDLRGAAASDPRVSLRALRARGPVVLVFGSYSCPNFRAAAPALRNFETTYGAQIAFLLVYVREAHAGAGWQSTRNLREGVTLEPAATMAGKQDHAVMCRRELHLRFPAVVDNMDGAVETAYNAWPSRVFIVGSDGRILYSSYLAEFDFRPEAMEAVLRKLAADSRRPAK